MKPPKIKVFFGFFLVLLTVYIFFVHTGLMAVSDFAGENYRPSDEEINFISALHTFNGEGLYKSVHNVYPPGRFFALALFFKMLGVSIPTLRLYFILLPTAFFPTFLFFLTYKLFKKYESAFFSLALATLATLVYLLFIYAALDVHVFAALFFIVLLSDFRSERTKNIILGILLGVVFLFRIEAGVFLFLSIAIPHLKKEGQLKNLASAMFGFLSIWIPVLIYFVFTSSLKNFIYDTIYPGLIAQPKLIDLPIPNALGAVFLAVLIFLFSATLSLYVKSGNYTEIRIFALFSILSFAGALVRSDEGHLWYGAVWLPIYISYFISQLHNFKNFLKTKLLPLIIPVCLVFFALGYFIIKFKSATVFVITTVIIFWFFTKKFKKDYAFLFLISGVITSLILFHSLSFIKLRFAGLPRVSFKNTFSSGLFQSEAEEIYGLKFSESNIDVLKKIKEDLDTKNKWLFIYPNNVLFYDYFKLKNPTRYYYFAVGTTNEMDEEIIRDLEKTNTNNFIFFPDEQINQKKVRNWILDKTYIDKTYKLGNTKTELRKRKNINL